MPPKIDILYGTAWKQDETERLVKRAIETGFRAIDTACQPKHYNEAGVGAGIAACLTPRLKRANQENIYLKSAVAIGRRVIRLMILRWAVLHARIGVAALGGFALCKRVVGAFLRRSGLQAKIVMHVLRHGRRTGQRCRKHAGNHDKTH